MFHFGHKISFLKSRLFVKSRFDKSRLYCIATEKKGEKREESKKEGSLGNV